MATDNPPQKPKPLLDKDGNPVVNQFGSIVSAPLTDEQKADIEKLLVSGKPKRAIMAELGVSKARLNTYLETRGVSDRIAMLSYTTVVAERTETLMTLVVDLVNVMERMETRLSELQTQSKMIYKACMRQKIGREKAEKEARSQKAEIRKLKDYIHQRTGKKW